MLNFPSPYEKILPHEIKLDKIPDDYTKDPRCDRVIGSLVGLAIGDALGASVEFRPQQYLAANPVCTMEGGGTWGLDAGKWTDDTSMALCLASSLIIHNHFNPYDQMVRYKWWHKYGYLSSTGHCFDIGQATRQSLRDFSEYQKILKIHYRCRNESEVDSLTWDSVKRIDGFDIYNHDENSAGNGALMRLAPVPLFFFRTPQYAIECAGQSASLTHASKKAIDACRYYAALIIGALLGFNRDQLFDRDFYQNQKEWFGNEPLDDAILTISRGSYKKDKNKDGYEQGIRGKGYIVNALEAALWAFWSDNDSFKKGALTAVNLGDDTDTTAAIYSQLAGAFYGYKQIPKEWLEKLYARQLIISMGEYIFSKGDQFESKHITNEHTSSIKISISNENSSEKKSLNKLHNSSKKTVSNIQNNYNHSISSDGKITSTSRSRSSFGDDHVESSVFKTLTTSVEDIDTSTKEHPFYRKDRHNDA